MATERRRALHQRSNSQMNVAAGIKQTDDVSNYSEHEAGPSSKDRKPSVSTFATSSEPKTSSEVNNYVVQNFPPPPPIPETPRSTAAFKSTIRLVPHSPLGATPVSTRSRSRSNQRSVSTGTRSRSSTTNSAGSRPRSRSSDFNPQRRGSFSQVSRGSSRHSTASYFSSISAIGLPPSRPLPTPPERSTGPVFEEVAEPLPSPAALPKLPKPILKKARTIQEIEAASPDTTPPIDADQFPEIRPALSWILETAPAPLKINKPKRARMQSPDDEISRVPRSNDGGRSFSNGMGQRNSNATSQWFSEASSSSASAPPAAPPSLNVRNVKGYNPHYWQAEGTQSQRATVFSAVESTSVPRGESTNPSYFNAAQAVPEWAR
ncbi:hypothetical protein ABW19_dt0209492 [Dactylella cylindrospora]|nr:hypothetical protein ABW19_dt0209492 [Dactylella cylindrospora]